MFEALFILTTIDTGTRIARFLLQELLGNIHPKFHKMDWWLGVWLSTALVTLGWGSLIWTGSIDTIWPMFGIANQLLAVVALSVVGTVMANAGRARYLWVAVVPMLFVTTTTMTAGFQLLERFWALTKSTVPGDPFKGYLNCFLIVAMMVCVAIILWESFRRWIGPPLRSEVPSAFPAAGAA